MAMLPGPGRGSGTARPRRAVDWQGGRCSMWQWLPLPWVPADPCVSGHLIAETGREDIYILLGPPDHVPVAYLQVAPRSLDHLLGTRVRACGVAAGRYRGKPLLAVQRIAEL